MAVSQEKPSEGKQEDVISRLNMAFPGLGGKVRAQIPVLEPEFFEELVVSFLVCLLLLRSVIKMKLVP